jgi:hypothetical protein
MSLCRFIFPLVIDGTVVIQLPITSHYGKLEVFLISFSARWWRDERSG